MPRRAPTTHRIIVTPCTEQVGCFRWVISRSDGHAVERSRFAHASAHGARIVGEVRAREIGIRV